MASIPIFKKSV